MWMLRCAGNLNGIYYDKLQPVAMPLRVHEAGRAHAEHFSSSLFGPTWCVIRSQSCIPYHMQAIGVLGMTSFGQSELLLVSSLQLRNTAQVTAVRSCAN